MPVISKSLLTIGAALLAPIALADWSFVDLHPPGATTSTARGVYNGVVVGDRDASITKKRITAGRALVWMGGWTYDVTPPTATAAYLTGTNGYQHVGQIYVSNGTPQHFAARWGGTSSAYTSMHVPGMTYTRANGISALGGRYVGEGEGSGLNHAFLWGLTRGNGAVDMNPAGWYGASANAVYGNTQVGWALTGSFLAHACCWSNTASSFQDLHWHGSFDESQTTSVCGSTAVGHAYTYSHMNTTNTALIWNLATGISTILHPWGYSTSAVYGVANGAAVGKANLDWWLDRAFYWDLNTGATTDLQSVLDYLAPGVYEQSIALAVYTNGSHVEIAGYGVTSYYLRPHAILWTYDPPA